MSNLSIAFGLFTLCLIFGFLLQEFLLIELSGPFKPTPKKWGFFLTSLLKVGLPFCLAALSFIIVEKISANWRDLTFSAVNETIDIDQKDSGFHKSNFYQTPESLIGFKQKIRCSITFTSSNLASATGNLFQLSPWEKNFQIGLNPGGAITAYMPVTNGLSRKTFVQYLNSNFSHTLRINKTTDKQTEIQVDEGPWQVLPGSRDDADSAPFQCRIGTDFEDSPGFKIQQFHLNYQLGGVSRSKFFGSISFVFTFWIFILLQYILFRNRSLVNSEPNPSLTKSIISGVFGFLVFFLSTKYFLQDFTPTLAARRIIFYITSSYTVLWCLEFGPLLLSKFGKTQLIPHFNRPVLLIALFLILIPTAFYHGTILLFALLSSLQVFFPIPISADDLLPWVRDLWDTTKLTTLLTFATATLFSFAAIVTFDKWNSKIFGLKTRLSTTDSKKGPGKIIVVATAIFLMSMIFKISWWGNLLSDYSFSFFLLLIPFTIFFLFRLNNYPHGLISSNWIPQTQKGIIPNRISLILFVLFASSLLVIFHNDFKILYQKPLKQINEFFVFSDKLINPISVAGDRRTEFFSVPLHSSHELIQWVTQKSRDSIFEYDERKKLLYRNSQVSDLDASWLQSYSQPLEQEALTRFLFNPKGSLNDPLLSKGLDSLDKNSVLHENRKTMIGYFFHHQVHIFYPIWRYHLDKKFSELNTQYGWLFTAFLYRCTTLGEKALKFENFVTRSTALYFAFIIVSVFFSLSVFRKENMIFGLLGLAFLFLSIYQLGFQSIQLAPGFVPFRQIFPLLLSPIILATWSTRPRIQSIASISLTPLLILAIFWNRETGVFLTISVFGAKLADRIFRLSPPPKNWFPQLILIGIPLLSLFSFPQGDENRSSLYYILGIGLPPTPTTKVAILIFILSFALGGITVIHLYFRSIPKFSFILFLWIYFSISLIYYVWNPAPNHLWASLLVNWYIISFGWQFLFEAVPISALAKRLVLLGMFGIIFTFLILARNQSNEQKSQFLKEYESHQKHNWSSEVLSMSSTSEFKFINQEREMVSKYAPFGEPITILSMEDVIYPLLLNHPQKIPIITIPPNLITKMDFESLKKIFIASDSKYVFVDNGYNSPAIFQTSPNSPTRLRLMRQFHKSIRELTAGYKIREVGTYLTVFEKK